MGKKIELGHLRLFGCTAYVYNKDPKRGKWDDKLVKCKSLGYEKGDYYRLWDTAK